MSLIQNHIGAVFIPVSDIDAARDWYSALLGIPADGPIQFDHIYVVPMHDGSGLVLDSKDFAGPHTSKPLFHFMTRDIHGAYAQMRDNHVDLIGEVSDGVFFNFKDPDGNLLMVADVPLPDHADAPSR